MWCKKQCSYFNPKYDLFLNLTRKFWSLNQTKLLFNWLQSAFFVTQGHWLLYLMYALCKNVLIVVLAKVPVFFHCLCLCLSQFFCADMHLWACKSTLHLTRSTPRLPLMISQLTRTPSFLSVPQYLNPDSPVTHRQVIQSTFVVQIFRSTQAFCSSS